MNFGFWTLVLNNFGLYTYSSLLVVTTVVCFQERANSQVVVTVAVVEAH